MKEREMMLEIAAVRSHYRTFNLSDEVNMFSEYGPQVRSIANPPMPTTARQGKTQCLLLFRFMHDDATDNDENL